MWFCVCSCAIHKMYLLCCEEEVCLIFERCHSGEMHCLLFIVDILWCDVLCLDSSTCRTQCIISLSYGEMTLSMTLCHCITQMEVSSVLAIVSYKVALLSYVRNSQQAGFGRTVSSTDVRWVLLESDVILLKYFLLLVIDTAEMCNFSLLIVMHRWQFWHISKS